MIILFLLLILVFTLLILVVSTSLVSAVTEDECSEGGGQWVVPSFEKEPFCQCGPVSGGAPKMFWNGSSCSLVSKELLCSQSKGSWINNDCICEMGQWIENYGCENITIQKDESDYIILLSVVMIIIAILIIYLLKKENKVLLFLLIFFLYSAVGYAEFSTNLKTNKITITSSSSKSECDNPFVYVDISKGGIEDLNKYFSFGLSPEQIEEKNILLLALIQDEYNGTICNLSQFLSNVNQKVGLGLSDDNLQEVINLLNKPLPSDVIEQEVSQSKAMSVSSITSNYLRPFGQNDVAPFLLGKVALISIFVNDPDDVWSDTKIGHALSRLEEVRTWMSNNVPEYANLNFITVYETNYVSVTTDPNNCQASNYTCLCVTWMEQAISSLGFLDSDGDGTRIDDYLEYAINVLSVENANLLFILHSGGSFFGTNYERSYACGINYVVPRVALFFYEWPGCILGICNEEEYDVYLHETLHNYGARDQYYQNWDNTGCQSYECTTTYNWDYTNANCENCNSNSQPSVMKDHTETTNLDYWNKGMIGWLDWDGDSTPDPLDSCMYNVGYYCNGCSTPNCSICMQTYCPSSGGQPYCSSSPSTVQCGIDSWEYGCPWGSNLSNDTGMRYHDYHCNGLGSCLDYSQNWQVDENCLADQYCYWDGSGNQDQDYYCYTIDTTPPNEGCIIISPVNNNYTYIRIPIIIDCNIEYEKIEYSKDGGDRFSTLCRGCTFYDREKSFDEGYNYLVIKSIGDNKEKEYNINFFIDSKEPKITKVDPKIGYVNGEFLVKYTEENVKDVKIYYQNNIVVKDDCESGKNIECLFDVDLSPYEGQEISFFFEVEDIVGNKDISKIYEVEVDTLASKITSLNYSIDGRYVYFEIQLDSEAEYFGYSYVDDKGRLKERRLCSKCDSYGIEKVRKKSFRSGHYDLTIYTEDEAENKDEWNIEFDIDY